MTAPPIVLDLKSPSTPSTRSRMPRDIIRASHIVWIRLPGSDVFQRLSPFCARIAAWPWWPLETARLASLQRIIRHRLYRGRTGRVYRARSHPLYRDGRDRELRDVLIACMDFINDPTLDIFVRAAVIDDTSGQPALLPRWCPLQDISQARELANWTTVEFTYYVDNWTWPRH